MNLHNNRSVKDTRKIDKLKELMNTKSVAAGDKVKLRIRNQWYEVGKVNGNFIYLIDHDKSLFIVHVSEVELD